MRRRIPGRYSYPGCPVQPCLAATWDTGVLPTGDSPLDARVRVVGQGEVADEGRDAGRAVGLGGPSQHAPIDRPHCWLERISQSWGDWDQNGTG